MHIFKFWNLVKHKCKNNHGVSILFALMFFLIASMVSITIVSAALSAVMSINTTKQSEQNSLTLESAVNLIKQELDDNPVIEYETVTDADDNVLSKSVYYKKVKIDTTNIPVDNAFTYELYTLCNDFINEPSKASSVQFEMQAVKGNNEIDEIAQCNVTMELKSINDDTKNSDDKSYELVITVEVHDPDQKMYITYSQNHTKETVKYDTEDGKTNSEIVESFSWNNATVSGYER